jgi:pimeloyl-ACP methyl ester carboxylesterase
MSRVIILLALCACGASCAPSPKPSAPPPKTPPAKTVTVQGTVRSSDGRALQDADVVIGEHRLPDGTVEALAITRADADGAFLLSVPDVFAPQVTLTARAPGYAAAHRRVAASEDVRWDVRLNPGSPGESAAQDRLLPAAARTIFWVTNRPRGGPDFTGVYDPQTPVTMGSATVVVSASGERLASLTAQDEDTFFSALRASSARSGRLVVMVHGYNTMFDNALDLAAYFSDVAGIDASTVMFSWPSAGRVASYSADGRASEASAPRLSAFLESAATRVPGVKIELLAHSMGARVAIGALLDLVKRKVHTVQIDNLVLAAPDYPLAAFVPATLTAKNVVQHITVYVSRRDAALSASKFFHLDKPRLGNPGNQLKTVLSLSGITVIDVSSAPADSIGHGYLQANLSVAQDIAKNLRDVPPPWPKLCKRQLAGLNYYGFCAGAEQ